MERKIPDAAEKLYTCASHGNTHHVDWEAVDRGECVRKNHDVASATRREGGRHARDRRLRRIGPRLVSLGTHRSGRAWGTASIEIQSVSAFWRKRGRMGARAGTHVLAVAGGDGLDSNTVLRGGPSS